MQTDPFEALENLRSLVRRLNDHRGWGRTEGGQLGLAEDTIEAHIEVELGAT